VLVDALPHKSNPTTYGVYAFKVLCLFGRSPEIVIQEFEWEDSHSLAVELRKSLKHLFYTSVRLFRHVVDHDLIEFHEGRSLVVSGIPKHRNGFFGVESPQVCGSDDLIRRVIDQPARDKTSTQD